MSDRGKSKKSNNDNQGFQSFEQLMAQRYPQTNRTNNTTNGSNNTSQNSSQQAQQSSGQKHSTSSENRSQHGGKNQSNIRSPAGGQQSSSGSSSSGQAGGTQPQQQGTQSSASTTAGNASGAMGNASNTKTAPSSSSSKKDAAKPVHAAGLSYNTPAQKQHLAHCDWKDKILWTSRLILGGNSINGFHRATATVQRIKKQRARQVAITKKQAAVTAAASTGGSSVDVDADKSKDSNSKKGFDQDEEEKLKKEIMNPRTAKKIKGELEHGLQFCVALHNILRGILFDIDPSQAPHLPPAIMNDDQDTKETPAASQASLKQSNSHTTVTPPKSKETTAPVVAAKITSSSSSSSQPTTSSKQPLQATSSTSIQTSTAAVAAVASSVRSMQSSKTTASPGDPSGSTLRKMRKKKLPPCTEPPIDLPEFDPSGRRVCSKKEHSLRLFKLLRFRALKQGDFVAARLTSRDLWILAMVQKDYPSFDMFPGAFVKLTDQKRDALFKDKVAVKDVEEKDSGDTALVPRNLVLPLPRTYSEAADWAQKLKKGSRVYAMYPQTTSLYSATVIDSTTYCRGDDDIIVVEFDGEEPDVTGQVPKYHIPARFVTLIPKEFPASSGPVAPAGANKRKEAPPVGDEEEEEEEPPPAKKEKQDDLLMSMNFDGNFDSLDLDFDKPLDALDEQDDFPPLY